jgi:hypothetical protein
MIYNHPLNPKLSYYWLQFSETFNHLMINSHHLEQQKMGTLRSGEEFEQLEGPG